LSNPDLVVLALVQRPHGLKGELKVELSCSGIDRLLTCRDLLLVPVGAEPRPAVVEMAFTRPDGTAVVRLADVKGREEAEGLRGATLAVPAGREAPAPEGSFLVHDLVGCRVVDVRGAEMGVVEELMETPANWVYVVRREGRELLIPAVRSMVRKVDLGSKRIVVDWPGEIDADHAD
jgi:16S rRNA processing protein RimM